MRRIIATAALAAAALGLFGAVPAGAQQAEPGPEPLRLACRVVATGPGAVACEWSPSESRAFHAYRLVRHDDEQGRVTVFRTNRRLVTTAVDRGLRPGRYRYWIGAFNRTGRVIGASDPVPVVVEGPTAVAVEPVPGRVTTAPVPLGGTTEAPEPSPDLSPTTTIPVSPAPTRPAVRAR